MPVQLIINGQSISAEVGASLFDCAEKMGIRVPTSCWKQGRCRECLLEVLEGAERLSSATEEERHLIQPFRLSCRCRVTASEGHVRCQTLRRAAMQIEEGTDHVGTFPCGIDPAVTRQGNRILLDGEEVDRSAGPVHGLAVDLGTTTVVVRLIDLESGLCKASVSFENPQRFGGSDVMSRIQYDGAHSGRLLQRVLLGYLSHAIEELPVDKETIYECVVVGNSTMRDLFFGLRVDSIGQKPYHSVVQREVLEGERDSTALAVPAQTLRLPIHPRGRVASLPLISGHVGADAAACLLATGLMDEDRTVLLMDIGTNTELLLGNRKRLFAASCPAGPAFEGGKITCGMPALEGAVERVSWGGNGRLQLGVIGGGPPKGICGSGLVDVLSELLRAGRMNSAGRFDGLEDPLVLDAAAGLVLRESDISELAQAKAANVAGLHIICKQFGVSFDQIDRFYLAGGFARHLDLDAARRIGFVPDVAPAKFSQIGNAAIEGAVAALLSKTARARLARFVAGIHHVELELDPDFFDYFVMGCQFIPITSQPSVDAAV